MTKIARLTTRSAGSDPKGEDGLLIGVMLEKGKGILKPYTVYSLEEREGKILLNEEGPSCGHPEYAPPEDGYAFNWGGRTFEYIICNNPFCYTLDEWHQLTGFKE